MSRRIEVELTSQRDDGTWTWRAAGAKQPKGTLEGALLYKGASVGDVCRVDADVEIDGIFVTAVSPLKSRSGRPEDEKIEVLGSGRDFDAVTTQLTRKPRSDKGKGRRRKTDTKAARERPDKKSKRQQGRDKSESRKPRKPSKAKGEVPAKPKPKKLKPKRVHRQALIESLPEEQRVIAEQVSRGGIAAVRKEIEAQNARAAEEGSEEVRADALVALAESLLPQLKIAEWRDRADAALSSMEEVDIRDLRTVLVAAEDAARDEESRLLADQIRVGLKARVEKAQVEWHDEIRAALKDERVVRALRLSSRPPKAGSPLPPDIAETLTAQANQAMGGDVSQQRLGIVLEAIAFSPIRPYIALAHLPAEPGAELLEVVQKIANRIPEIALRFGIEPQNKRKGRKKPRPKRVQSKNSDDEQASEDQHPSASQESDQAPSEPEASPDIKAEAPPEIEVATDQEPDGSPDKELPSDQHPSASQEADQAPSEPEASPDIKAEAPPEIEVATDQEPDGSPDKELPSDQHPSASQEADQAPSEPEASPDIKAEAPPEIEVATDQEPDGSPDKELHPDQHP